MKKKMLAWLLALCMAFSSVPITVNATESADAVASEPSANSEDSEVTIGNVTYVIVEESNGVQVIDGKNAEGDIVIPEKVTIGGTKYPVVSIAANAFNGANEVTSIEVPNSVTTLGAAAFANMDKLKTIKIGNGVTSWGDKLAVNNSELENVVIAEGATLIGNLAFRTCPKLANVTLPSTLKTIGATAFAYSAITELNIPASVEKIGADAFKDIDTLKKVTFNSVPTHFGTTVFQMCDGLEEVVLPEGLTVIPQGTFRYCTALKTINFPESLTEIGNYSFQGCTSLESVTISKNITNLVTNAFNGCTSLKNLTIEEGFAGTIGAYVFQGCTALESVVIPSTMETVGESMFNGCTSLKFVTLNEGVKTLNISAFANCTALETLTLPDSLERMRHGAIANCTALKELIILGDDLPVIENSNALDGLSEDLVVVYNGDDAFTGNWSAVADNVVKIHEVETKAELDAAVTAAKKGDKILLTTDIDYTGTATLVIDKAITLDLGGYTLTTNGTYGGIQLKNGCTLKNGTLNHKGTVTAIKAWTVEAIEDLVIDVAFKAEGKTIGGIVIQQDATGIDTIKNVTIKGEGLTNGIETYNCGNAAEPVIGSMENVTIEAKSTGMLISAPCGTATNCNITGGTSGIEIWIKGTYSASLDLKGCTVKGGVQAVFVHDEFNSNPDVVNNGKIELTADEETQFVSENATLTKAVARVTEEQIILPVALVEGAVAEVNGTYYKTFRTAVDAANAIENGAIVTLLENVTLGEKLTISGDVTISGEHTITRADNYPGTLFTVASGATLTLDGGLVIDGGNEWTLNTELYNKALNREADVTWAELITSEEGAPNATAAMFVVNGYVLANNVTIQNNYSSKDSNNGDGGIFKVETNAKLTMTGAQIKHIVTGGANSVAHLSTDATWTINNGTSISDTFAARNGGVCRNDSGKIVMNGGEIKENNSLNTNGTVFMMYMGSFEMNGGKICSNTGVSGTNNGRCAAIYLHNDGTMTMNDGEICHNTGISYGGVDTNKTSAELTVTGGYIGENISVLGNTNHDVNMYANTSISGGTFTQDVTQWLEPDLGMEYDEETGTYGLTRDLYEYNGTAYQTMVEVIEAIAGTPATADDENSVPVVTVLTSHKVDEAMVISTDLVIDLNGKTITGAKDSNDVQVYPVIRVQGGANVTVKNGTITNDDYVFVLGASDGSSAGNLTIESGTYHGDTTVASVTKGTLTITGGEFSVDPYEESYEFLLNCIDANYKDGSAKIVVTGGTFHNFDPSSNAAEGTNTNFVPEGYYAKGYDDDSYYEVLNSGAKVNNKYYETLVEAVAVAKNGDTVYVTADHEIDETVVTNKNLTIDLGGYKVTAANGVSPTMFRILSDVTVKNGTLDGRPANAYTFILGNSDGEAGTLTIESGTYFGQTSVASVTKGTLTIEGGEFKINPYIESETENYNYLLNCIDSSYKAGTAKIVVKGGTFHNFNPANNAAEGTGTSFVTKEYIATETEAGSNTWTVQKATPVAKVFREEFNSIVDALEYACDGDTVTIIDSHEITESVIVDKNIILDFGENTVTATDIYPVFRIQNGANVIVKGGTVTNNDYVFVLGASDGSSAGNLTIESGTYHGDTTVASVTKGILTITGGEFSVDPYEESYEFLLNCIDANYKDGSAKIVVTGGTFHNFNPEENAAEGAETNFVATGYSAYADSNDVWTVRTTPVVINATTGEQYDDVSEALSAAASGQTVQMNRDYTEEDTVIVSSGVKFDLNGQMLEADNVLAFGHIVDTATEVGGIKISNDTTQAFTQLQPDNEQLPIYDTGEGCYRFFEYELVSVAARTGDVANQAKFGFKIIFTNPEGYKVLSETTNSEMKLVLNVTWTGLNNVVVHTFSDTVVKTFATTAYERAVAGENITNAMVLYVNGIDKLVDEAAVCVTPRIETVSGIVTTSDELVYYK